MHQAPTSRCEYETGILIQKSLSRTSAKANYLNGSGLSAKQKLEKNKENLSSQASSSIILR